MFEIGTRKLKLFLNKKVKKEDKVAEIFRIALEAEDENIKAMSNLFYSDYHNKKKEEYILRLIDLCKECGFPFWKSESDISYIKNIIYFELPNCGQINFHTRIDDDKLLDVPKYEKTSNEKESSTMLNLEKAIIETYKEELLGQE